MVKQFKMENGEQKLSKNFKIREFRCKCGKCKELLLDETLVAEDSGSFWRFGEYQQWLSLRIPQ